MRYCTLCELFIDPKTHFHEDNPTAIKPIELGIVSAEEEKNEELPLISDKICTFCGAKKVVVTVKQIRGLDEAPTIFEKCLQCNRSLRHD